MTRLVALSGLLLIAGFASAAEKPLVDFDRPVTIVCLGDSVTGVYYHTGGLRAYPEMLEIALRKAHPAAKVSVVNAGISGHTTRNGLARLETDVLSRKPTLVTVSFGLNDMVGIAPDQFRKNLVEIVNRCRAIQAQVVLCTPNAVIDTSGRPRTRLVEYCDIIRGVARDLGLAVCDQHAAGEAARMKDAWAWRLTMSDEIHPNMDGHKRMAEELCKVISGTEISLADVAPPLPAIPKTLSLLKQQKLVRVLAMPPCDAFVLPALKQIQESATAEVTVWDTPGKTLPQLEKEAQDKVRKLAPDLMLVAIPREAASETDEQFVKSYTWVLNWSLSFGRQEWDCVVVHPFVTAPGSPGQRDDLIRKLVEAQHLHLLDRPRHSTEPAEKVFLTRFNELAAP